MNSVPRAVPLLIAGLFFLLLWVALVLVGPFLQRMAQDLFAERPHAVEPRPAATAPPVPAALPSAPPAACVEGTGQVESAVPIAPAEWLMTDDYPAESLFSGEQGKVRATMTVDKAGRVADCSIVESSGFERLDRATCNALMRRGRFEPARNAAGCPIVSQSSRTVRWVIPQ